MKSDDMRDIKRLLLRMRESDTVEIKKAKRSIPDSFWETYSAFSNTNGGIVVLGMNESEPDNEIVGVEDASKILNDLWNVLSNENKVSYRTVNNQDAKSIVIDDKTVVLIKVNEAPNNVKPVYINGKIDSTWLRTGDGDRKAKKDEIASMLRNAQPVMDSLPIDKCTLDDLDEASVLLFKQIVNRRYPKKKYLKMEDKDFLLEIGACRLNRDSKKYEILHGTLLFLGKVNAIKEFYPHFHLDYFDRRGDNPRWRDRVSDDEPNDYELNIFNFYKIVDDKLRALIAEPFVLDGKKKRKPVSDFDESLRECLVNCLAHADYNQGYPSTKIQAYDGWFSFFNPGEMLIPKDQFQLGGESRPRNEIIMKMFRLLGASERQGFGGPMIYKTALENDYRQPEIQTNLESTEIKVWNIDLATSYPELSQDEKQVLRYLQKVSNIASINELSKKIKLSYYKTKTAVNRLLDIDLIERTGNGPSTKYMLKMTSGEFFTMMQVALDGMRHHLMKRT